MQATPLVRMIATSTPTDLTSTPTGALNTLVCPHPSTYDPHTLLESCDRNSRLVESGATPYTVVLKCASSQSETSSRFVDTKTPGETRGSVITRDAALYVESPGCSVQRTTSTDPASARRSSVTRTRKRSASALMNSLWRNTALVTI